MQVRKLGRTGIDVTVLSYGCGAVGGLMTRGEPHDQERAVGRALEYGIRYFDTAPQYGDGKSEENLGRVLATLKPHVAVGTKVRIMAKDRDRIAETITASIEKSLKLLRKDYVDLFQLHNVIDDSGKGDTLDVNRVLTDVIPTFQKLKEQGKTRFLGFTSLGETPLQHKLIDAGVFDTGQICYNALNPSAGGALPARYPGQDYGDLFSRAAGQNMGTIGIRVLAAGALSGSEERHPLASPSVAPIGSAMDYKSDVLRAQRFEPLIREGHAGSLPELAVRFAISHPKLSTTLVGIANIEQFEAAAQAAEKGPLSPEAMARVREVQASFSGEAR